jgi:hypothetical protein
VYQAKRISGGECYLFLFLSYSDFILLIVHVQTSVISMEDVIAIIFAIVLMDTLEAIAVKVSFLTNFSISHPTDLLSSSSFK